MAKFTPFPTFGGKQGIVGVQPVQLPQVRTSFPTARPPARRAPEPTTKEKLGGLAPLFLRGAAELFRSKPQPMLTPTKFYESIGADPEDPSRNEQAQLAAYTAYGPQRDVGGFRGMDLADIVVASQMGRGAPQYVSSALKLRQAEDVRDTNINTQRGQLIKEYLKPDKYNYVNIIDKEAAQLGLNANLSGRENDRTGELELLLPNGKFTLAGPNYLKQTGTGNIVIPEDPKAKAMKDIFDPIYEKESSVIGLVGLAGDTINNLRNLDEGALTPNTLTSSLVGLGDRARIEFNNLSKLGTFGIGDRLFANLDDVAKGTGGSLGREGDGQIAKNLYEAIQSGDEEAINKATLEFEKVMEEEYGFTLKERMEDTVYNDVRLRSQFLQLAYTAAAVNGQTGRTLSDKDLAYHIQIVGLGQTTNPEVLIKNLEAFVNDSITNVDRQINLTLQQQFPNFARDLSTNEIIQSYFTPFYTVPQNEAGQNIYSMSIGDYSFRPFATRRPGLGIENFTTLPSPPKPRVRSSDDEYNETLNNILGGS